MENTSSPHPKTPPSQSPLRRVLRELLLSVLPAILLGLFIRTMVAEAALVDGPSMQPNLYTGFAILAEKVSYHLHAPQRGDVVLFDLPREDHPLVKRVIALPGEQVAVRGGHTYIDGELLAEPWVTYFGGPDYPATRVPAGAVFVLGDNRRDSRDSRFFGPVPLSAVRGHVILILWPPARARTMPQ
jgi:signal peptidase I